ncbi:MAG: tetratricopeptide repeat protein [Thermodesulfovibrionales bacterium]|nr:tetratricopeptide repeat protein [Thermodesulfovibrionales bacterium]
MRLAIALIIVVFSPLTSLGSEGLVLEGENLLKGGNYLEARRLFHSAYLKTPRGSIAERALLGVAKADYNLKRYYEARQNLKRVLATAQDPNIINEAYFYLGLCELGLYNYRVAERYLSSVSGHLKKDAVIGMAECALRLNDVNRAETLIKTLSSSELAVSSRGLAIKAMIDSLKGRHDSAVKTMGLLSNSDLKKHDLLVEKAQVYYYANRLNDAEKQLKEIINAPDTTNVNRLRALRVLWYIYTRENKIEDALKTGNALLFYERSDEFKRSLADMYLKQEDFSNALRVISYIDRRRLKEQETEKILKAAMLKNDPSTLKLIYRFGNFISPDSPFIVQTARYIANSNDKKTAIEMLKRATRGNVAGPASLLLSELLLQEKRFSEAKKALEFLTLDPRYAKQASLILGEIMEKEGKVDMAIHYYKKLVNATKDANIADKLGDMLWGQGKREEAINYYIIASNGGNEKASIKVGDYFYIKGDTKKAIDYYKKGLNAPKEIPEYQWVNYQYGKLTHSKDYLKKAAEGNNEIAKAAKALLKEF